MAEHSARWCDDVLPLTPHSRGVFTVPFARRALLEYRPELAQGVLAIALEVVSGWLAERAEEKLYTSREPWARIVRAAEPGLSTARRLGLSWRGNRGTPEIPQAVRQEP